MCVLIDAIPVTFGPHEGDWWLVGATIASLLISSVLAFLAYRNGQKATKIAEAAAARDQEHRDMDTKLRADAARSTVGLAMMRALAHFEVHMGAAVQYVSSVSDLDTQKITQRAEALAQVDIYTAGGGEAGVRTWFADACKRLDGYVLSKWDKKVTAELTHVRLDIVAWTAREVTASSLIAETAERHVKCRR